MTARVLSFFVVVFVGCSLAAAQSDRDAIVRVLENQVEAWNKGDVTKFMTGYWRSDSTAFVSGGSMIKGYDTVLQRYRKNYGTREKMGTLTFSDLNVRVFSGTSAVVTGAWKLIRKNDRPGGRFTLIFGKKPEGWRIVYDHTSAAQ
jgi:ketosteroid isomerase-like protein